MEKVMRNSPETNAIRQRMEEVRGDLHKDAQGIVEGVREMGEWRSYVRSYPWVCAGAALALGYLLVPRRAFRIQPDARTVATVANQSRLLATSKLSPKKTAGGILLAFVGTLVLRGVASYVGQRVGKLFAGQATESPQDDQP